MSTAELLINLTLIIIFFTGSWFFSGFESGAISLNRHRLVYRIRHGDKKARALARLLRDSHRLLATTLVGNNICNVTLSTLTAALATTAAAALGFGGALAQTIATVIIATLLLIIGEYLPKLWFTSRPIERCIPLLPIFQVLRALLSPLASLCIFITRLVTPKSQEKRSPFVSRESIAFLMRDSEAQGEISPFERIMVSRVLDLQLRKTTRLMTPLSRVDRVYESDNLATVLRVFRQTHHRILPMFSDDGKRCTGVIHLFDLLRSQNQNPVPADVRRPAVPVRSDTPSDELLPYMRVRRTKILIVHNDEKIVGIVTQQDILNAVLDDELLRSSTDRRRAPALTEAPAD